MSDPSPPATANIRTGPQQDEAGSRLRWRITLAASVLMVALVVALSVSLPLLLKPRNKSFVPDDACRSTRYPEMCFTTVSRREKYGPRDMLQDTARAATRAAQEMLNETMRVSSSKPGVAVELQAALDDCVDLLASAVDELQNSLEEITKDDEYQSEVSDIQTWMSAALTYEDTCTDEIQEVGGSNEELAKLKKTAQRAKKLLSNALALVKPLVDAWKQSLHPRRLLGQQSQRIGYNGHRHLTGHHIPPNVHVVVAADGSGQFRTIQDAVNAAPRFNHRRYVVHIRAGVYKETVNVKPYHTNIVFVGDGQEKTIITGSKSATQPGITTITSATVAVEGRGFMARDLTIQNTAGPRAGQAVALRVAADRAAFFRCSFHGYQDTLLAHTLRQFFRDCTVTGTVDYVFGNAAAVFQNCNFRSRVPLPGQQTVVTAQGRTDPAQTTGFSFHMCTVGGDSRVYLGRPWKEYARVVWLRTNMAAAVDPAGWLTWGGTPLGIGTSYFAEYRSWGPGGNVRRRVPWSKVITKTRVARRFMPVNFIAVSMWLPRASVLVDEKL